MPLKQQQVVWLPSDLRTDFLASNTPDGRDVEDHGMALLGHLITPDLCRVQGVGVGACAHPRAGCPRCVCHEENVGNGNSPMAESPSRFDGGQCKTSGLGLRVILELNTKYSCGSAEEGVR